MFVSKDAMSPIQTYIMRTKKGIEHSSYFKFNDYNSIYDTYVHVHVYAF